MQDGVVAFVYELDLLVATLRDDIGARADEVVSTYPLPPRLWMPRIALVAALCELPGAPPLRAALVDGWERRAAAMVSRTTQSSDQKERVVLSLHRAAFDALQKRLPS